MLKYESLPFSRKALNTTFRSLGFRMAARVGATAFFQLGIPLQNAPYTIFGLLEGDSAAKAKALLALPPCLLDPFSAEHLRQFSTEDQLTGADSKEILRACALLHEVDIAARECGHAASRRLTTLRSVQTHSVALEDLGAEFVCHQFRKQRSSWYGELPAEGGSDQQGPPPEPPAPKRGGGAWRAFVHCRGQGGQSVANTRQLADEYKALPAEEMARYVRLGAAGTQALQAGSPRAFSLTPAMLRDRGRQAELASASESLLAGNAQASGLTMASVVSSEQVIGHQLKLASALAKAETKRAKQQVHEAQAALVKHRDSAGSPALACVVERLQFLQSHLHADLQPFPSESPALISHDRSLVDYLVAAQAATEGQRDRQYGKHADDFWGKLHSLIAEGSCRPIKETPLPPLCRKLGLCQCKGKGKTVA